MFEYRNPDSYTHSISTVDSYGSEECSSSSDHESPKYSSNLATFSKKTIDSVVEVSEVPGKGRCLFVRKEFEPGSLIFAESPLFMILPSSRPDLWEKLTSLNQESAFTLPPLWHKAALLSIIEGTDESNKIMANKWVERKFGSIYYRLVDPNQEVSADVYRVLGSICTIVDGNYYYNGVQISPEVYQLYLQVWPLNAFGRSSDPDGLVIYDKISYLAHSCNPSCCWHHTDDENFVLRARKKLIPGDEITISYLGESDLLSPTFKRRTLLQNWHFFCTCDRCSLPVDLSRGFLCKYCHYGTIFLRYDSYTDKHTSTECEMCKYKFTETETNEYIELERAYMFRIDEIDKSDLMDMFQVYDHAKNVFRQHWSLYQLETMMYEYYKENGNLEQAKLYLLLRLHYVDKVVSGPLYLVAFMHEELADILTNLAGIDQEATKMENRNADIGTLNMIMSYYYNAAALLAILCGYNHNYYYSVVYKRHQVEQLAVSLMKKVSAPDSTNKE
ncbi:uncharacterized protein TOT_010000703 [Theileria orientalis strain Shintoku]|uniref:SET domain-containing protein n=1 Tax=Theileria orientalis strain Shintoku TaxID=869250 RepID=J4DNN0_THEOR|nr:uncharacterized protein TOT_010000703 [Theileria orientalis strain Shintoku]BAM39244.1 uncharacterized protein TOT_010000703 [Theileria orientalis strain Shintoku]|eukprot:XP_009689545.1 uncharacterized protein TOT_010000703 [Theileria orientalis strain Shintoku]